MRKHNVLIIEFLSLIAAMVCVAPASAETLRVMTVGLGSGTVISTPAGINCADCDGTFPNGATVTLMASAGGGSTFVGWNDPSCPGTGNCVLTMSTNRSIRPEFRLTNALTAITVAELNERLAQRSLASVLPTPTGGG